MTYCLGISTREGLVFISDSRTNAGVDHINTYSKMHVFKHERRFLVLLVSGNLATTQGVVAQVERDLREQSRTCLASVSTLDEAAEYIGEISVTEQNKHANKRLKKDFRPEASFILGGQLMNDSPGLIHVYPEGNFVHASQSTPFLQVGEVKYGKPILDRILVEETTVSVAVMCGLVSMDSTMRSSAAVGPPIEYLVYMNDSYAAAIHRSLDEDNEYLLTLRRMWSENLRGAFKALPDAPGLDSIQSQTRAEILKL
ncbi:MAG: peptidase [Gammaproteobacteria bacterium]|nr:peptidase [Gammaproteobacteria bacterium]MYD80335.1 peptidase [Gammaproteobacteria bacterium]